MSALEQRVCSVDELREGAGVHFTFHRDGIAIEAFATLVQGGIVAYENLCRHLPLTLDYGDHRFFTRDGRYLICQNHGALFEPANGLCVRGPCLGASLKALDVRVRGGELWHFWEEDSSQTPFP